MTAQHVEVLVEEPSMEAFLRALLPRILPRDRSFEVHPFQGKSDLFGKLRDRLRGYASWLPDDWRIVVVVDRDDEDCHDLKRRLERTAANAGLSTRSRPKGGKWQLVNRVAIEELEAWYFGDWEAVRLAYPRVTATVPRRSAFRSPDAVAGGDVGGLRAGTAAARILRGRVAQDRRRESDRRRLRPSTVQFAQLSDLPSRDLGGDGVTPIP